MKETRPGAAFAHVETWIFDLDNTLYPARVNLFAEVDRRMTDFIARTLSLPPEAARTLQKDYYRDHGTTLRGLMDRHGLDPTPFLDYVHEIDLSRLAPNPALGHALTGLPGRRVVYTNGSEGHARRVLCALGIEDVFEDIVDIVRCGYEPKPQRAPLERLVAELGIAPTRAAMFEDIARNLEMPHAMGMTTVLVRSDGHPDEGHVYEHIAIGGARSHVDHVTDDLVAFLEALAGA